MTSKTYRQAALGLRRAAPLRGGGRGCAQAGAAGSACRGPRPSQRARRLCPSRPPRPRSRPPRARRRRAAGCGEAGAGQIHGAARRRAHHLDRRGRSRRGAQGDRSRQEGQDDRRDRCRAASVARSGRAQADRMGDPARRGRRVQFRALCRLHRRQSGLAAYGDVPAQGGSRALAGQAQRKHGAQLSSPGRKPTTAKGRLALARAAIAQGDRALAAQYVREAWRNDALGADIETQVLDSFGPLLNGGDHKARMERRLYAEDTDAGLRAANGSAARRSRSPKRGARSATNPRTPRRCSMRCRKMRAAMPATCSPASSGCGAMTNSRKPRS